MPRCGETLSMTTKIAVPDPRSTESVNDEPGQPARLSRSAERRLAQAIEVGLFASVLLSGSLASDASEAELRLLVEDGERARQQLYLANLGLVGALADRWAVRAGLPRDELFQEGCVGLGEAIQLFDWRRGYRFSTLAWKRISYSLMAAAALRCGELDSSLTQAKIAQRIRRDWSRREAELGQTLTARSYAQLSGQSDAQVMLLARMQRTQLSEDPADHYAPQELAGELSFDWRGRLTDDERRVIELRFFGDSQPTLADVGEQLSYSAAKVRRLEQRALRKIKGGLEMAA